MLRLLVACILVSGVCIAAVVLLGPAFGTAPGPGPGGPPTPPSGPSSRDRTAEPAARPEAGGRDDGRPATIVMRKGGAEAATPLTIMDARVMPVLRQDVPSRRNGQLLVIATEVKPGEFVPKHKLITQEMLSLAIPITSGTWAGVAEPERIIEQGTGKMFRHVRPADLLTPGSALLVRHTIRLRSLEVGDRVEEGQLLGIVDPALAIEDLGIRLAKVEGAQAEVRVSGDMEEESARRLDSIKYARSKVGSSVSLDDLKIAEVTVSRYKHEKVSKAAAVKSSQKELAAAYTTLRMHHLRASISGVIRSLYKQPGEAVKELDAVLQIQSPDVLRVEAQVEVQDAVVLRQRLARAEAWRNEAQRMRVVALLKGETREPIMASQLMRKADDLTRVEVEAARQEPPLAALSGHTQEVTCVGVTAEADPRIVSGSEDNTVRLWKRVAGEDRWTEQVQLDHHAVVRCLAVTGPRSERQLLLTGTATGRGRIFDLKALDKGEVMLKGRHTGGINAVTFSADGKWCVTGGDDAALCLWDTETGDLLGRVANAHRAAVTSAAFTPKSEVVTAGRDKRLIVWKLAEGGEGGRTLKQEHELDRRSGDVAVLGTNPEGSNVLFDDGRDLRVQSLEGRSIAGTLRNPPGTASFAHFALFSPDGKTILTGGSGPGRLQLWRAPGDSARAAELRQYLWGGTITSGAFAHDGKHAVTGTSDNRVLVWQLPTGVEVEKPLAGSLTYVEEFLDTSLRKLTVRADVMNPGWVIPGASATIVVPPLVK